jgi:hypothetical protein
MRETPLFVDLLVSGHRDRRDHRLAIDNRVFNVEWGLQYYFRKPSAQTYLAKL